MNSKKINNIIKKFNVCVCYIIIDTTRILMLMCALFCVENKREANNKN
jgi:hypothetical protein